MERTTFLNKVRDIVILQDDHFNHNDIPEEEFTEFVESMLNASYKINGNMIFVDIDPDAAIFIYEHFMCDALPEVGYYQTFVKSDFDSSISIYSYISTDGLGAAHKYENLTIPFALSHEDIVAEFNIISPNKEIRIGRYGVRFEMDRSSRKYKVEMFLQGFEPISLKK